MPTSFVKNVLHASFEAPSNPFSACSVPASGAPVQRVLGAREWRKLAAAHGKCAEHEKTVVVVRQGTHHLGEMLERTNRHF